MHSCCSHTLTEKSEGLGYLHYCYVEAVSYRLSSETCFSETVGLRRSGDGSGRHASVSKSLGWNLRGESMGSPKTALGY